MANPENKIKQPWESQPCPMCRASKSSARCPGHGGGSGNNSGGASGSSASSAKEEGIKASQSVVFFSTPPSFAIHPLAHEVDSPILAPNNIINAEVILKLLQDRTLTIDNNSENSTLTIKVDSNSLSPEQKSEVNHLINEIVDELHAFESKQNITSQFKFDTDKKGNILSFSIKMPTKESHNAFMQQLSKNSALQNIPKFTNQEKADSAEKRKNPLPAAFSTRPRPLPPGSKR